MAYLPGQSGNPAGRKKGGSDKRLQVKKMLEAHSEELVAKVIEMALSGDGTALKIVFDRICPKPRSESVNLGISLGNVKDHRDMIAVIEQVMRSALGGELPDDQGRTIASLTKTMSELYKDLTQVNNVEKRLKVIEKKDGITPSSVTI